MKLYVGKIKDIKHMLKKDTKEKVSVLQLLTQQGDRNLVISATVPVELKHYHLFHDNVANKYSFSKESPSMEDVKEIGSVVGEISMYQPTYTTSFTFDVYKFMEPYTSELSFVSVEHDEKSYLCQISRLRRYMNDVVSAEVNVVSGKPKSPFTHKTLIKKATKEQIEELIYPRGKGIFNIGKLYGIQEDIPLKITTDGLENGVNFFGIKGSGKSHASKIFCEEACMSGKYGVLIVDVFGELIFKFPNPNPLKASEFGITPQGLNNPFISFNEQANPFTDAVIDMNVLQQSLFYKTILKPGQITTLSIKGLAPKDQSFAVAIIASKLRELGLTYQIPDTVFMLDEAQEFAREGEKQISFKPLMDLNTNSAHARVTCLNLTQRKSALSKNILAHANGYVVLKLQDDTDIDRLPSSIKKFKHMINTLPTGVAIVSGITPFQTIVQIRESVTRDFRGVNSVKSFFEDAKGGYAPMPELQTMIDNIEIIDKVKFEGFKDEKEKKGGDKPKKDPPNEKYPYEDDGDGDNEGTTII